MPSPVVRFAPSPTGKLHVGNVRTALINWLFAKNENGKFILRVDDTDTERSTQEYEAEIKADLEWLGLVWDDTFSQSDRFEQYDAAADRLREKGLLYACYETSEELDRKRKIALSRGRPPVYDRAALQLSDDDRAKLEAEGRRPHWRFKLSGDRIEWTDLVRGPQGIDTASVSDPVLIREDGSYLYTLPSVVDDIDADVTHVVRGEDHVTNSGAQIEIFRALGGKAPQMAHTPLLVDAEGGAFSKRLGSLNMETLQSRGILPMAILSLLAKLGTSDNIEVRSTLAALTSEFSFDKIGRAPAKFDEKDLLSLNAVLVHELSFEAVKDDLERISPDAANERFWMAVRPNCETVHDIKPFADIAYGSISSIIDDEDADFIAEARNRLPDGDLTSESWKAWTSELKEATGRKGKGLFMPLRKALTGQEHGPDMAVLFPLIGRATAERRLSRA
jgi:glutamyl-tRNA synthetase